MPPRIGWTRDQQLIALRLYLRVPFGKLHRLNRDIISLAEKIGRTPSALAMKASNFASLDPAFRATNRSGLTGASESDRAIWSEFSNNAEAIAAEVEDVFARIEPTAAERATGMAQPPVGDTDVLRLVRVRRVQSFFRAAVLTSYDARCAISGIALPELLVASHIIPWNVSIERRADPTNGICLNALFDKAFDRGLLTIDEDQRVVVSKRMRDAADLADLHCSIAQAHGRTIRVPTRLAPDQSALAHHREHIFVA